MKCHIHNNNFQVIIFDLDGTLYPREVYISTYYEFAICALMELLDFTKADAESLLIQSNISNDPAASQASVSALFVKLGIPLERWNRYRDSRLSLANRIPYDRYLQITVRRLKSLYRLVVNTNNTAYITSQILFKLGFSNGDFSLIVTSDSDVQLKPLSTSFLYVANQLNTSPKQMLSVGDRYEVDVEPLLALGGSGVVVTGPEEIPCVANQLLRRDIT